MIKTAESIYDSGKESLESLLRKKAYSDVQENLEEKGIDINQVSDEDIEVLVAAKAEDMTNEIKGLGKGLAFSIALFLLTGI